ncbi:MAG: fructose-specific PTS transporter subunit EIIC [Deltaproteobacteria bacterium]|jgi:PTS system fructose-specific IIC component|nr:fructose-specific PTS transporter subunit EIIC [Deltaproteobacteria bacterium]
MKITDLLAGGRVALAEDAADRDEAIGKLCSLMAGSGAVGDLESFRKDILERETKTGGTSVGMGIATPHAKSAAAAYPALAAVTLRKGVDWGADDGEPADLLFMISTPPGADAHVDILARLMGLIVDEDFPDRLRKAANPAEFLEIIDSAEAALLETQAREAGTAAGGESGDAAAAAPGASGAAGHVNMEKGGEAPAGPGTDPAAAAKGPYRLLAVTACPTGIAHTYMAAEKLDRAGKKLQIPLKVETNGSGGVQNPLTAADIEGADAIIVAADKKVETARFDGKKVLFAKVSDGIHRPEELIGKAMSGDVPVYREQGGGAAGSPGEEEQGLGRALYMQLMNGVSNMLPFVIGGGILIALAFLLDDFNPNDPGSFGSGTPLAAFFKTVGGASFSFMLPVLAGFIAYAIADRPGLVAGFVGGALAVSGDSFASLHGAQAVSGGFLAALFAGFAGGYIMVGLKRLTDGLPDSLRGLKPTLIFPLLGVLAVGLLMFAVNPVMGVVNTWLANGLTSMGEGSKVLLGFVLGGMMATDMGGPINKASYVFGTAAIANGNYDVMAAVMIGGMTPPIGIALLATFFKSRLAPDERKSAYVNYVMGLCFITEGAIPFAAADPLRVIPSCLLGSGVAGAMSMAFGCGLRAPHGGIFVFPVVSNWESYLVALAVGSVVTMIMLALLKKNLLKTPAALSAAAAGP